MFTDYQILRILAPKREAITNSNVYVEHLMGWNVLLKERRDLSLLYNVKDT